MDNILKKILIVGIYFLLQGGVNLYSAKWEMSESATKSLILPEMSIDSEELPAAQQVAPFPCDISYNPQRTEFLIVWAQFEKLNPLSCDIYGAFLDEETGNVTKEFPIIKEENVNQFRPSVAFDGEKYLVVYEDRDRDEIYGIFVSQDGVPSPSGPFRIRANEPPGFNRRYPSVAFNNNPENPVYLVTWSAKYQITVKERPVIRQMITGMRIDPSGNQLDQFNRLISPAELDSNVRPSVASNGEDFAVVWVSQSTIPSILLARLFRGNGQIGAQVVEVSNSVSIDTIQAPGIAFTTDRYLVVYKDIQNPPPDIFGAFLDNEVNLIGNPFQISSGGIYPLAQPACTFKDSFFIVEWARGLPGPPTYPNIIYAKVIDLNGNTVVPETQISLFPYYSHFRPNILFGEEYGVSTWIFSHNYPTLHGRRIRLNLTSPDPSEIVISRTINSQTFIRSDYDGNRYLVVWQDNRRSLETGHYWESGIYATFLTPKGEIVNSPPILISDELGNFERYPDIAFGNTKYLVAYTNTQPSHEVKGVFVTPDGGVSPEFLIHPTPAQILPLMSVSGGPDTFLVVSAHLFEGLPQMLITILDENGNAIAHHQFYDNFFQKFSTAYGNKRFLLARDQILLPRLIRITLFDLNGNILLDTNVPDAVGMLPSTVFDGENFFIVYQSLEGINGFWVSPDGTISSIISLIQGNYKKPKVEFDGWEYLITFEDREDKKIKAIPLHLDGTVLGQIPWIISEEHPAQRNAHLTKGPGNQILATYEGLVEDPFRAFGKFLEFFEVDDSLSLAFNSNVNIQRDVTTDSIHFVYARKNKVYYRKGGILKNPLVGPERILWQSAFEVGDRIQNYPNPDLPSIDLDSLGNPHIAWSSEGNIYYRNNIAGEWSPVYTIVEAGPNRINTAPTISAPLNPAAGVVPHHLVHIIYIESPQQAPPPPYTIKEAYFRFNDPTNVTILPIYTAPEANPVLFPSVDFLGTMHLAFATRTIPGPEPLYEIYYATRELPFGEWQVWGNVFPGLWGTRSITPMTEVYGDSVYIVWTRLMEDGQYEVVKASHYIGYPPNQFWQADNFSRTPTSPPNAAIYQAPINAWGEFTVWVDQSDNPSYTDIFTRRPPDFTQLVNLTKSASINDFFPQIFAKFTLLTNYLGLIWQEKEEEQPQPLYNIRSQIFKFLPIPPPVFYTVRTGNSVPSIHITYRDSFITNWQYPVDIGYDSISAGFVLDPRFEYDIEITAYHEGNGEWREFVYFDGKPHRLIKYEAYEPKTVKIHVPKGFYNKDHLLNVSLKRRKGEFATLSKMLVYRYETEEKQIIAQKGGIQSLDNQSLFSPLRIYPNPFKDKITIDFGTSLSKKIGISLYDITGRTVKKLIIPQNTRVFSLNLSNKPKGIYFIRLQGEKNFYRVIKIW